MDTFCMGYPTGYVYHSSAVNFTACCMDIFDSFSEPGAVLKTRPSFAAEASSRPLGKDPPPSVYEKFGSSSHETFVADPDEKSPHRRIAISLEWE